ncbi:aprataxin and PNK-like factor, partial [Tachysurus ichikawai]
THVNPCFFQTSVEASPQPLEKDKWHLLKDGAVFSLLPGKHIYRVRAVAEGRTPRNSQGFEEEETEIESETEQNSKSSRSCEETLAYTPQAKHCPSFTYEATARDEPHTADSAACDQVGFKRCSRATRRDTIKHETPHFSSVKAFR